MPRPYQVRLLEFICAVASTHMNPPRSWSIENLSMNGRKSSKSQNLSRPSARASGRQVFPNEAGTAAREERGRRRPQLPRFREMTFVSCSILPPSYAV